MEEDQNSLIYKDCLLTDVLNHNIKRSSPDLPSICLFDMTPDIIGYYDLTPNNNTPTIGGGCGTGNGGFYFSSGRNSAEPEPDLQLQLQQLQQPDPVLTNLNDYKIAKTKNITISTAVESSNQFLTAGNARNSQKPSIQPQHQTNHSGIKTDHVVRVVPEKSKDHCYISDSSSSNSGSSNNNNCGPKSSSWHHQHVKPNQQIQNKYKCQNVTTTAGINGTLLSSATPLKINIGNSPCKSEIPLDIVESDNDVTGSPVYASQLAIVRQSESIDSGLYVETPSTLTTPEHLSDGMSVGSNVGSPEYLTTISPFTAYSNVYALSINGECVNNNGGSLRHRSKMHDLALKHNLISSQDTKSNGTLILSAEERRTLIQEGFAVPTSLPLTKKEDEALKLVRRKIKNKLSAQESRRRRKEYIDALEKKLENCETEKSNLRRRVDHLEHNNQNLLGELRKLQHMVGFDPSSSEQPNTTGVALTAFFLIFAIIIPTLPVWSQISLVVNHRYPLMSSDGGIVDDVIAFGSAPNQPDHPQPYMLKHSRVLSAGTGGAESSSAAAECVLPDAVKFYELLMSDQGKCALGSSSDQPELTADKVGTSLDDHESMTSSTSENRVTTNVNCSEACDIRHYATTSAAAENSSSKRNDDCMANCNRPLIVAASA